MRISDWSSDVCSSDLDGSRIKSGMAKVVTQPPPPPQSRHQRQYDGAEKPRKTIAEIQRLAPGDLPREMDLHRLADAARDLLLHRGRDEECDVVLVRDEDRKSTRPNSSH